MPTKEQLETALRNADAAGDTAAAKTLANALRAGDFDAAEEVAPTPAASLSEPEPPANQREGRVTDFLTGNDRETRATRELPELSDIGVSGLLGEDSSAWQKVKATAGSLFEFAPEDIVKIIRANTDANVSTFYDEAGNVGINVGGRLAILNKPGVSAMDALQGGATAAAFTPAGRAATGGLAGALKAGALSAGTQAGIDVGTQATGRTNDVSLTNIDEGDVALAGAFGFAAPFVIEKGGQASKGAFRRLTGKTPAASVLKPDGSLTDDAVKALEEARIQPSQLDDELRRQLTKDGVLTPEQAQRYNLFRKQGVDPTRAQITQTADDFQAQQEFAKTSNAVRSRLDSQEAALIQRGEDIAESTAGLTDDVADTGQTVYEAVIKKVTDLDDEVSSLYNAARTAASAEKGIRPEGLLETLSKTSGQNQLSGGLHRAVFSELKQRGLTGPGMKASGRIDVNAAEEIRQTINQFMRDNPASRRLGRQFIDALDDDVLAMAGDDVFKSARQARVNLSKAIEKSRLSKFDKNMDSTVQKILENNIAPERIFDKVVVSKSGRIDDLRKLKEFLLDGTPEQIEVGTQAWNNLRGQTVRHLVKKATSTAGKTEGQEAGQAVFNGNIFRKEVEKVGRQKLKELFGDDLQQILDLKDVGVLRIPVSGTQQGKGPSAQAVSEVVDVLPGINRLARIYESIANSRGAAQSVNPVDRTRRALEGGSSTASPAAFGAGASTMQSQ